MKQILFGVDWPSLGRNIRSGKVKALAISATHVASGKLTGFIEQINATLSPPAPLRCVRALHIRPSRDRSEIAVEYLLSPELAPRAHDKTGHRFKDLAAKEPSAVAAASHLLFDAGHADRLMELGCNDARARHDELVDFFAETSASKAAKTVAA